MRGRYAYIGFFVSIFFIVLLAAGCSPAPAPEPSPTPTVAPPVPDHDRCATEWTTLLQIIPPTEDGATFRFIIRFDEEIYVPNMASFTNPASWTLAVARYLPFRAQNEWGEWEELVYQFTFSTETEPETVSVQSVRLQDDMKTVWLEGRVLDPGPSPVDYPNVDFYRPEDEYYFNNLLCDEATYEEYILAMRTGYEPENENDDPPPIMPTEQGKYADVIAWGLDATVIFYDMLGNPCAHLCGITDSLCCATEPCPDINLIEPVCPL